MRELKLTGVSNEQDLDTEETKFLLVFNGGELRVPVSEEAVQVVLQHRYGEQQSGNGHHVEELPIQRQTTEPESELEEELDDGVDQV